MPIQISLELKNAVSLFIDKLMMDHEFLKEEGIFRVPPLKTSLEKIMSQPLKYLSDENFKWNFEVNGNANHLKASVLKKMIEKLFSGLITPDEMNKSFSQNENVEERLKKIIFGVARDDVQLQDIFIKLAKLIEKASESQKVHDKKAMSIDALSTCFEPNVFVNPGVSLEDIQKATTQGSQILSFFVRELSPEIEKELFSGDQKSHLDKIRNNLNINEAILDEWYTYTINDLLSRMKNQEFHVQNFLFFRGGERRTIDGVAVRLPKHLAQMYDVIIRGRTGESTRSDKDIFSDIQNIASAALERPSKRRCRETADIYKKIKESKGPENVVEERNETPPQSPGF